jgi:hypothetical protein
MSQSKFHIVPYTPEFEPALLKLERNSTQGSMIQLEMIRDNFLSRSIVFENYRVYLGLTENGELAGVTAGAIVPFERNGERENVGIGYDLKVAKKFRRQGLSKQFGSHLVNQYFLSEGIKDFFITLKTNNVQVAKAAYVIERKWHYYDFIYLTIPTYKRIKEQSEYSDNQLFKLGLFSDKEDLNKYFSRLDNGLGIWNTDLMYSIKLRKLHSLMKVFQKVGNIFSSKEKQIPGEGEILKFATLFDYNFDNFYAINEVLAKLQKANIQYLNVCCRKGDFVWDVLKPLAMNAYPYTALSTFNTNSTDKIKFDVRCF